MRASAFKLAFIAICIFVQQKGMVQAASSQWKDLGGAAVRLVAIIDPSSLALEGFVDVRLEPGWSTYWRNPGGSGIPPDFHFQMDANPSSVTVLYPTPKLIEEAGKDRYAGYKGRVRFPIKGRFPEDRVSDLSLDLLIGLCETICIPARASLLIPRNQLLQSDPVSLSDTRDAFDKLPRKVPFFELVVETEPGSEPHMLRITVKHGGTDGDLALFAWPGERFPLPGELLAKGDKSATFGLKITGSTADNGERPNLVFVKDGEGFSTND